ncbi:citryl-CoA lyase [Actinoplanes italicus]|uniref:citrate synthase (unknown stereospecificity) n=1 Tax=Actinoplanes italicus TaxID=113567 RepID=A0A2T0KEU2_9ACTN|nr:citryl-CoA lyase [Actinoplanes italicus]PRX21910.1 citrate synthase [Actinoplanes italicus]GIE29673.1 citryl-CoA lyase [Actinoplanes italicus]
MSRENPEPTVRDVADWWATSVSRVEPNLIELRGRPVQDLIGSISFPGVIWLMLRGEPATPGQERLLEAALVSSVDHGPHAPSIAVARMAATCGVGLNNAVATGVNLLGDVHGGAGEQCMRMLSEIAAGAAAAEVVGRWRAHSKYLPGFGHRFHTVDPRRDPLLGLVERAVADGTVEGAHLRAARAVEELLADGRDRPVPINIDGCTAVVYGELGFPPPLARGLFVLSRSVGILAHAWEETGQGRRNKGPMPPSILPTPLGREQIPWPGEDPAPS